MSMQNEHSYYRYTGFLAMMMNLGLLASFGIVARVVALPRKILQSRLTHL